MVSDRTIYTDMYDEMKAILVANTISHSPTITSANSGKQFSKPTVAIHPLNKSEVNKFFGDSEGAKTLNVVVDCFGLTGRDAKEIMQDVEYYLKNNVITGCGYKTMNSNYNEDLVSDNRIKYISSTFVYTRRT